MAKKFDFGAIKEALDIEDINEVTETVFNTVLKKAKEGVTKVRTVDVTRRADTEDDDTPAKAERDVSFFEDPTETEPSSRSYSNIEDELPLFNPGSRPSTEDYVNHVKALRLSKNRLEQERTELVQIQKDAVDLISTNRDKINTLCDKAIAKLDRVLDIVNSYIKKFSEKGISYNLSKVGDEVKYKLNHIKGFSDLKLNARIYFYNNTVVHLVVVYGKYKYISHATKKAEITPFYIVLMAGTKSGSKPSSMAVNITFATPANLDDLYERMVRLIVEGNGVLDRIPLDAIKVIELLKRDLLQYKYVEMPVKSVPTVKVNVPMLRNLGWKLIRDVDGFFIDTSKYGTVTVNFYIKQEGNLPDSGQLPRVLTPEFLAKLRSEGKTGEDFLRVLRDLSTSVMEMDEKGRFKSNMLYFTHLLRKTIVNSKKAIKIECIQLPTAILIPSQLKRNKLLRNILLTKGKEVVKQSRYKQYLQPSNILLPTDEPDLPIDDRKAELFEEESGANRGKVRTVLSTVQKLENIIASISPSMMQLIQEQRINKAIDTYCHKTGKKRNQLSPAIIKKIRFSVEREVMAHANIVEPDAVASTIEQENEETYLAALEQAILDSNPDISATAMRKIMWPAIKAEFGV